MGYQALLFCPDEKLARIVAQVFSELDFNVEPVQEPFCAVKKLMAQRYDALVIDCESESNASLLFKSARNSSSNQGTLAIAMVEGQAGVAKAYRIGANLVLTKPINVEQAKGTLRVARGLLRKGADAAGSGSSASAVTPPPAIAVAATQIALEHAEFEPVSPASAAPAGMAEAAVAAVPVPEASEKSAAVAETPASAAAEAPKELVQPAAPPAATVAALNASSAGMAGQAVAAAPAKVPAKTKELPPAQKGQAPEFESMDQVHQAAWHDSASAAPAFAFVASEARDSGGLGIKKIMVGAVVLLAAAVSGYFAWTTLGQHKPASPAPASAPQSSAPPPVAPMSAPATGAAAPATDRQASTATLMPTAKVIAAAGPEKSSDSLILHVESAPAQPAKAPTAAIVVKPGKRARVPAEEAAAPAPTELAAASANEDALSSVIATTAATPRQPTLATMKISQGVSQGLLIKKVNPVYPLSAKSMHVEGAVLLEATIDREGRVVNPIVVKGDKVLARAALDAVRQWRYKPYYLDKQPVEIQTQITINFKLPK